jgi:hypothetical protein
MVPERIRRAASSGAIAWIVAAIMAIAIVATARAQTATDKLLTAADVEKISGVKGVKAVKRGENKYAFGDLNFVAPDGNMVVQVNVTAASVYDNAAKMKEMIAHTVPNVGDAAFVGPPGSMQYVLYAKKGSGSITVNGFLHNGKPSLTETQVVEIGRLILSRQ